MRMWGACPWVQLVEGQLVEGAIIYGSLDKQATE